MPAYFLFFLLPLPLPAAISAANDPSPGVTRSKEDARNLDCVRLAEGEAHDRFPGIVSEPLPRGSFIATTALVCKTRIFAFGERPNREEAILSRLTEASIGLAAAADTPAFATANWLVDAFYPDQIVGGKLAFAAKVALMERGRHVSDRIPVLAAGDILVLSRMSPLKAYPLACARYYAEGSMSDADVLLGVALVDPLETNVHAGVCAKGVWRWVQ